MLDSVSFVFTALATFLGQYLDVGGGGQCDKKILLHLALEAHYDTAL